jgi:DNA repair protein RadC
MFVAPPPPSQGDLMRFEPSAAEADFANAGAPDWRRLGQGHRARLRERFARAGAQGFTDVELLEMLLGQVVLRSDTKPVAQALVERFGSLGGVLAQQPLRLQTVRGVGAALAMHLSLIQAVGVRAAREAALREVQLSGYQAAGEYLRQLIGRGGREVFVVLFLDARNALIAEHQVEGTVSEAPAYPREIARMALERDACGVILGHNHPTGRLEPSPADIATTRRIAEALRVFTIACHDHFIVGATGFASMRSLGHTF